MRRADSPRKAARHFAQYDADYYLILAGDHLYRMDYAQLLDAHHLVAEVGVAASGELGLGCHHTGVECGQFGAQRLLRSTAGIGIFHGNR